MTKHPAEDEKTRRRPAVFFDRDGTLIEQIHYLSRPQDVKILPGAAQAVCRFQRSGYACIVVTNQSAIGRGIITETELTEIHDEMREQFSQRASGFDAIYHCAVVPAVADRVTVEDINRKPGPGMLLTAAVDLDLDLSRSWMIGDMISDALAGKNAGCQGSILVSTGHPLETAEEEYAAEFLQASDISAAAELILNGTNKP